MGHLRRKIKKDIEGKVEEIVALERNNIASYIEDVASRKSNSNKQKALEIVAQDIRNGKHKEAVIDI